MLNRKRRTRLLSRKNSIRQDRDAKSSSECPLLPTPGHGSHVVLLWQFVLLAYTHTHNSHRCIIVQSTFASNICSIQKKKKIGVKFSSHISVWRISQLNKRSDIWNRSSGAEEKLISMDSMRYTVSTNWHLRATPWSLLKSNIGNMVDNKCRNLQCKVPWCPLICEGKIYVFAKRSQNINYYETTINMICITQNIRKLMRRICFGCMFDDYWRLR